MSAALVLVAALDGVPLARVSRGRVDRSGEVVLTYYTDPTDPDYQAVLDRWPERLLPVTARGANPIALSPSLPIQRAPHRGVAVLAYLAGLLPDDAGVRAHWANQFDVPDHPVDLLAHMGLDCPGAVQFVPWGQEDALARSDSYMPWDDARIGARLRQLRATGAAPSWTMPGEHWSLGGMHAKFALASIDGTWHEAQGAAATTHLFKPGIRAMNHQAVVEFATMRTSISLGLPTAQVDLGVFDGETALIVRRFDRIARGGAVRRLHQVDMCQALGVMPNDKYESRGGPRARAVVELMGRVSTRPVGDVEAFSDALLFNYLAECPDGHAKNLALFFAGTQARLAPLYDLATGAPYDKSGADTRAAFAIGGVRRFGELYEKHVIAHATEMGLDPDARRRRAIELAQAIPDAFRDAFNDPAVDAIEPGLGARLWHRMNQQPGSLSKRCATAVSRLRG